MSTQNQQILIYFVTFCLPLLLEWNTNRLGQTDRRRKAARKK
jgi:hypothetical protein